MDFHLKLRNLLVMAAADGSLTEREVNFLADRCDSWGLTEETFVDLIEYAVSDNTELAIPDKHEDRVDMLKELLRAMAADGKLADEEKRLFAAAAVAMNISDEELARIINETVS